MRLIVWCLLLLSAVPFVSAADSGKPHVVFLVAEREYRTDETLPAFAKKALQDYRVTFVFADPQDKNVLQGVEAVDSADLLVVSMRRRTLPPAQLDRIRRYVTAGKPVIGIRTASHAFCLRNSDPPQGRAAWPEFDAQVFGGNYTNHYGNSLKATIELADRKASPDAALLRGLESTERFVSGGSLYKVSPLADAADVLMIGRVEGQPAEPVAWTYRRSDGGKSFYTSLGHVEDFRGSVLPTLLANAIGWALSP